MLLYIVGFYVFFNAVAAGDIVVAALSAGVLAMIARQEEKLTALTARVAILEEKTKGPTT